MAEHPLDIEAGRLTKLVNDRISEEAPGWSHFEYVTRVEEIVREMIPDTWEWVLMQSIGSSPRIALIRYSGPKVSA